jgi:hypothetical protein
MILNSFKTERRSTGSAGIDKNSLQLIPEIQRGKGARFLVGVRDFSTPEFRPSADGRLYSPDGD